MGIRQAHVPVCISAPVFVLICLLKITQLNYMYGQLGVLHENVKRLGGCCCFFFVLRWLITVSSTFQEVDFDGSLLPLFIT